MILLSDADRFFDSFEIAICFIDMAVVSASIEALTSKASSFSSHSDLLSVSRLLVGLAISSILPVTRLFLETSLPSSKILAQFKIDSAKTMGTLIVLVLPCFQVGFQVVLLLPPLGIISPIVCIKTK